MKSGLKNNAEMWSAVLFYSTVLTNSAHNIHVLLREYNMCSFHVIVDRLLAIYNRP